MLLLHYQRTGSGLVHGPSGANSAPKRPNTDSMNKRLNSLAIFLLWACITSAAEPRLADAAEKSDRATIRTLLKQRADVNAPQADGMTALHWAAYHDDLEMA